MNKPIQNGAHHGNQDELPWEKMSIRNEEKMVYLGFHMELIINNGCKRDGHRTNDEAQKVMH